jgi:hypothetical protein
MEVFEQEIGGADRRQWIPADPRPAKSNKLDWSLYPAGLEDTAR